MIRDNASSKYPSCADTECMIIFLPLIMKVLQEATTNQMLVMAKNNNNYFTQLDALS